MFLQAGVTDCLCSLGSLSKALMAQLKEAAKAALRQSLHADGPTQLSPQVRPYSCPVQEPCAEVTIPMPTLLYFPLLPGVSESCELKNTPCALYPKR